MPVPGSISELNKVAASNSPQGTESAKGTIDDYLRTAFAFIAQLAALAGGATATLASASTVAIGFAGTANINITGTNTISAFDTWDEGALRYVTFGGALTLAHNAGSLSLPGGTNIAAAAGDSALFKSLGGGNWKCLWFARAAGTGPVAASSARDGYLTAADWNAFNSKQPALGYTPYNASNPASYVSASDVNAAFFPRSGGVLNGPLILPEGSIAQPSLTFANEGGNDTGFFHQGDGVIGVTCNGVLVARFTPSGLEVIKVTQSQ